MSKNIPTKINNYNVYNEGEKLLGVGDELTLPDFEATSETVSGAGILGEIDDPTIGHFGNMQLEIPFRTLDSGVTLNILYILIEVNGESVVELDKMNPTYKVNGVDLLAEYKEMC